MSEVGRCQRVYCQCSYVRALTHEAGNQIKAMIANVRAGALHVPGAAPQLAGQQRWHALARYIADKILAFGTRFCILRWHVRKRQREATIGIMHQACSAVANGVTLDQMQQKSPASLQTPSNGTSGTGVRLCGRATLKRTDYEAMATRYCSMNVSYSSRPSLRSSTRNAYTSVTSMASANP